MTATPPPADGLFVIACPVCRGELSAATSNAGRAACCPLCTATFLVPAPRGSEARSQAGDAAAAHPRRGRSESHPRRQAARTLLFLLAGAAVLVGVVLVLASRPRG